MILGCLALLLVAPAPVGAVEVVWKNSATATQGTGEAIALDESAVYVAASEVAADGTGWNAAVRKYDVGGNIVWARTFGTAGTDRAAAIAVDSTGIYVAGTTNGDLEGRGVGFVDAYLRKFD